MQNILDQLKALIDHVQRMYLMVTELWKTGNKVTVNFKKTTIANIDDQIYEHIVGYIQFLNECSAGLLGIPSACLCKVSIRVKTQNSVEYKIQSYKTFRAEAGAIPINKCLNDLFGIRIILPYQLSVEEICEFVQKTYQGKYRCIDSSKGDYKAVHLYFKQDNQSFPWELQIWNACDEVGNLISHKKYKQEYTTWEKESREGGIIDG